MIKNVVDPNFWLFIIKAQNFKIFGLSNPEAPKTPEYKTCSPWWTEMNSGSSWFTQMNNFTRRETPEYPDSGFIYFQFSLMINYKS